MLDFEVYNIDVTKQAADKVIETIQKAQKRTFLPIIGKDKGQVLVRIVEAERPQRILEIGTLVGYSAILMAKHLAEGAKIVSIEVDKNSASQARKNIASGPLTAVQFVEWSWDKSPGHRTNMLSDWNEGCGGVFDRFAVFIFAK